MTDGRRFRVLLARVPVVSMLTHRWRVMWGSEVIDFAFTKEAAERRAKAWATTVRRWNGVFIERVVSWW
jgi:hypothetical protein